MIPTSARSAGHVHKPMIRFLGRRVYNSPSPPATCHPFAPEEVKSKFSDFLKVQKNPAARPSSSTQASQSKEQVLWYDDPSELPWQYKSLSSTEIELVNGGGVIR